MRIDTMFFRSLLSVVLFCGFVRPALSNDVVNADLIFSYTRTSSLQPRITKTPDIRLYSDLTAVVYRPAGYKNQGEHRIQLSKETFVQLMQTLTETISEPTATQSQQSANLVSIGPDLQNFEVQSDPTHSTILLTETAKQILQEYDQSINLKLPMLMAPSIDSSTQSIDKPEQTFTTQLSDSSILQKQLLKLYKNLDGTSNNEVER